jgi:ABC-type glutathione transport system ATPase component
MQLRKGEAVGIVGESGSGKSTLARSIVGLEQPSRGEIFIDGRPLPRKRGAAARLGVQMIFQDPTSTLNPFQTIGRNLQDVFSYSRADVASAERRAVAVDLLSRVGISAEAVARYPQTFSGGQRQRIAIARALAAAPRLLVCDEPTSALDVSVQAQVLSIFRSLKDEGLSLLFISHNLAVVRQICDTIIVMKQGQVVENGAAEQVISAPSEAYTKKLLAAAPRLEDRGYLLRSAITASANPI